jgi:hypothetical protein
MWVERRLSILYVFMFSFCFIFGVTGVW